MHVSPENSSRNKRRPWIFADVLSPKWGNAQCTKISCISYIHKTLEDRLAVLGVWWWLLLHESLGTMTTTQRPSRRTESVTGSLSVFLPRSGYEVLLSAVTAPLMLLSWWCISLRNQLHSKLFWRSDLSSWNTATQNRPKLLSQTW